MSNLYQVLLCHDPSDISDTTPSDTTAPVTIPSINSTHLTQIVGSANEVVLEDKGKTPYSFSSELIKLRDNSRRDFKVIALYWSSKGFEFQNREQFDSALRRELRAAKDLKGYTGKQISQAIDYCKKNYDVWTLETVGKRIMDLVNKR
jgi:hypothetical protein